MLTTLGPRLTLTQLPLLANISFDFDWIVFRTKPFFGELNHLEIQPGRGKLTICVPKCSKTLSHRNSIKIPTLSYFPNGNLIHLGSFRFLVIRWHEGLKHFVHLWMLPQQVAEGAQRPRGNGMPDSPLNYGKFGGKPMANPRFNGKNGLAVTSQIYPWGVIN